MPTNQPEEMSKRQKTAVCRKKGPITSQHSSQATLIRLQFALILTLILSLDIIHQAIYLDIITNKDIELCALQTVFIWSVN